jgi:hypothetical protein
MSLDASGRYFVSPASSYTKAITVSSGITPCPAFGTTQSCAPGIVLNISTACSGVTMSRSPTMRSVGAWMLRSCAA